jgi:hypothetical protein
MIAAQYLNMWSSFWGQLYNAEELKDYFYENGLAIEYSAEGKGVFIQVSKDSGLNPVYKDKSIFGTKARDLVHYISLYADYDPDDEELGYSFIFPDLELSLWRPVIPVSDDDTDGQFFETIGIGQKGYWMTHK